MRFFVNLKIRNKFIMLFALVFVCLASIVFFSVNNSLFSLNISAEFHELVTGRYVRIANTTKALISLDKDVTLAIAQIQDGKYNSDKVKTSLGNLKNLTSKLRENNYPVEIRQIKADVQALDDLLNAEFIGNNPTDYAADGVHPTETGAKFIGKEYAKAIAPIIESLK